MFFDKSFNDSLNLSEIDDSSENLFNQTLFKNIKINYEFPLFNLDKSDILQSLIIIWSNTNEISEKKDIIENIEKNVINEANEKNVINEASEKKDTNETSEKKDLFKTEFSHKKRGRKTKGENKKQRHCSTSFDNIMRKIQVHFLNFLCSLLNDSIRAFASDKTKIFLEFDYKMKSKISSKNFNMLKNSTIGNLFKNLGESKKYKRYKEGNNKFTLEALCKDGKDGWFKKIFKIKYKDLFQDYYNDRQPLKELTLFDKTIKFSEDTKPFFDLMEKNKNMKEDIINVIQMFFLPEK